MFTNPADIRKIFVLSFFSIVLLSLTCGNTSKSSEIITKLKEGKDKKIEDTIITIIGVGDIMMGTNYPNESYLPPQDGKTIFDDVKTILQNADLTFGNLEGCILNSGGTVKSCKNPATCYAFRTPVRYGKYLVDAGFDFMNIANNHNGDFGTEGRLSTKKTLDSLGIKYAGLVGECSVIFERDGIKYGFAGFAPNSGTCDIRDINEAVNIVKELKKDADIIIISFHGGAEGPTHQNLTKGTEMFLGENRGNVVEFSHKLIDAGADIIFGHGPHVTRAVEVYKDRFIAYSLGNFCTYGRFSLGGPCGFAPIIKVSIKKDGTFEKAEITSIKQIGEGGPLLDEKKNAISIIQRLTSQDFPDNNISISDEGIILQKEKVKK